MPRNGKPISKEEFLRILRKRIMWLQGFADCLGNKRLIYEVTESIPHLLNRFERDQDITIVEDESDSTPEGDE